MKCWVLWCSSLRVHILVCRCWFKTSMTQLSYRERHNVHELCFTRSKVKYKKSYFLRSTNEVLIYFIWYLDIDFKETVTCFLRMCGILISGLVNLFSRFAFGEKILFRRPWDAREGYYISIQELYGLFWKF